MIRFEGENVVTTKTEETSERVKAIKELLDRRYGKARFSARGSRAS